MGEHYDAVIIGSGQGGGPLSTAMGAAGYRTALIEREYIGGTCINSGCTPTKTMIASGRVAYLVGRSADYGVNHGAADVDMRRIRQRKRDIVESFRSGSEKAIRDGGVEILMGEASFAAPRRLKVKLRNGDQTEMDADRVFIDTGTRPIIPPIEGLESAGFRDSTSIMELDIVPEHLLILGGGYVGLEFGQLFRRLGSRVTIVEQAPRLLGREDEDVVDCLVHILKQDGIEIITDTKVARVSGDEGAIEVTLEARGSQQHCSVSHLLVATGRRPNTDMLHLQAAGIDVDERGFLKVDDRLQTTATDVYGLGEVAGTPAFTHMSYDDFRILRDNLLHGGNRTTGDRQVPYCMFTDPQLGRVGQTEYQARKAGHDVVVAVIPMAHVARAIETDETRGMAKIVADAGTKQILGFAALAIEGGEIMAMVEIAMMGQLPYTALREGIFAHPTLAELFNNLAGQLPA